MIKKKGVLFKKRCWKVILDKSKCKGHSTRRDAREEKAMRREVLESKFYRVKVSDMIRIVGKEETCIGCQELGV